MKKTGAFLFLALSLSATCRAQKNADFMMGSVVKSDVWKMDRTNNIETFTGDVSFRNPRYLLKADYAVYNRNQTVWDLSGSVYTLRYFLDRSELEMKCDSARYLEAAEEAFLERGALPVRMKYRGADGRILNGRSDKARAENKSGLMHFSGAFFLATENLELYSEKGLYDNKLSTFLLYDSTVAAPGAAPFSAPVAIGKREGYDFAIAADSIKFFRNTRDINFYNKVTGWAKNITPTQGVAAPGAKNAPRKI